MKALLMPIKPEWTAKIINGEKTIEVRKSAPKCELPIEVYIYCTKSNKHRWHLQERYDHSTDETLGHSTPYYTYTKVGEIMTPRLDGKVVAKFTLREVTQYINGCNVSKDSGYMFGDAEREGVYDKACLSEEDIERYCPDEAFYAWHISDLEIFDEPKELSEFYTLKCNQKKSPCNIKDVFGLEECHRICKLCKPLTKAPQSWFYVEERK